MPVLSPATQQGLSRVALSGAELQALLVRSGARVVASLDHGDFLGVQRHLVFVRRAQILSAIEVYDALRLAGISPSLFRELLHQVRGNSSS